MRNTQFIKQPKRVPREVTEFRMTAFCLELSDHDHRDNDVMLIEPQECSRVRQQYGRIEDVSAAVCLGHEGPPGGPPSGAPECRLRVSGCWLCPDARTAYLPLTPDTPRVKVSTRLRPGYVP